MGSHFLITVKNKRATCTELNGNSQTVIPNTFEYIFCINRECVWTHNGSNESLYVFDIG